MNDRTFDRLTRAASPAGSRRASLKALGAAALGAALAQPLSAAAKKRRKKRKKNCGKKRRKQCTQEIARCRSTVEDFCRETRPLDPAECEGFLLPCCATCDVQAGLFCVLNIFED